MLARRTRAPDRRSAVLISRTESPGAIDRASARGPLERIGGVRALRGAVESGAGRGTAAIGRHAQQAPVPAAWVERCGITVCQVARGRAGGASRSTVDRNFNPRGRSTRPGARIHRVAHPSKVARKRRGRSQRVQHGEETEPNEDARRLSNRFDLRTGRVAAERPASGIGRAAQRKAPRSPPGCFALRRSLDAPALRAARRFFRVFVRLRAFVFVPVAFVSS